MALPALEDLNIADVADVGGRLVSTSDERPNGNWDDLRLRYPGADFAYNALQVGLNRLFSDGMQFRVFYTYSKNMEIVFDGDNDPIGDTGRTRDSNTTSRQLQFGLQLAF